MSDSSSNSPLDVLLGAAPRRARRHLVSIALLAVAVIAIVLLLVRFVAGTDSPYYVALVQSGDIAPLVSERGIVHGSGEKTVTARAEGMITAVPGPARGPVKAGQVLVVMDAGSTRQSLEIGRAEVAAAQASLEAARVTVRETASRLARFESVWRRSQGRAPSLGELEAARADAARARQEEEAAASRMKAAQLRVSNGAEQLGAAVVRSPIDGYVVVRHVRAGTRAHEGMPLFTLAAGREKMTIAVPLATAQGSPLRPGAKAVVRIDELPDEPQSARLVRLIPGEGRQQAVFQLEQPLPAVMPGMEATVELPLPERRGVLLVPNAALEFSPDNSSGRERDRIYLLSDDGERRRVYVSTGASDGQRTEIFAENVTPGARVIIGWRNAPANSDGAE